jgi:hypothetical protein
LLKLLQKLLFLALVKNKRCVDQFHLRLQVEELRLRLLAPWAFDEVLVVKEILPAVEVAQVQEEQALALFFQIHKTFLLRVLQEGRGLQAEVPREQVADLEAGARGKKRREKSDLQPQTSSLFQNTQFLKAK